MTALRQRQPRQRNDAYLAWIRRHRCCTCWANAPVEAAHIRMASAAHEKRETGKGEKPDDRWSVPLCASCHRNGPSSLHRVGDERRFFAYYGIDVFEYMERLWWHYVSERTGCRPPPRRVSWRKKPVKAKSTRKRRWPSRRFPKGRKLRSR